MRILITGAAGFLGSYVVEELVAHGHEVAVLLRDRGSAWRLAEVIERTVVVAGSLQDLEAVRTQLQTFRPSAVAHLAWQGVAPDNRNTPHQADNIPLTVGLATLAADLGAQVFIGAGSQAEYGPYDREIRDDDLTRPTTLYGHAKLAAGLMARQVAAERGMRFAWMRIFSTYGPKDHRHWLIPSLITALQQGRRMPLTRGEQRWSFLHARDTAAAFRTVLESSSANGVFNLSGTEAPPLRQTVTMLQSLVNPSVELGFGELPYRPDQVMTLKADLSRLQSIGWRPAVGLEEGLRETVAWHARSKHA